VGSVDFVAFDFFSSIFRFQGLVMIAKRVASCNIYLAEALQNAASEGLPRHLFLEWQFLKDLFCCAPAIFDNFGVKRMEIVALSPPSSSGYSKSDISSLKSLH
jgi:hypothetical protein